MDDCIFCRIIGGALPSYKIYEDEKTYAFLDIAGDFEGHTLVVPKAHCTDLRDCGAEDLAAVTAAAQKIARHYTEKCGYDGVNLFTCSGRAAPQSVFHFHVHVIPRRTDDGLSVCPTGEDKGYDLAAIRDKLALD